MLNKMKSRYVAKNIISYYFYLLHSISAQQFKVIELKAMLNIDPAHLKFGLRLKEGEDLQNGWISFLQAKILLFRLKESGNIFNIGELSAVSISSIKKMSTDELLLALAMEDMINAPKTNGKGNSSSTATYGNKEGAEKTSNIIANDFGILKIEWCNAACRKWIAGIISYFC